MVNQSTKKSIKIKNCLFKRYKKYENIELGKKYREYRNKLNGLLRSAEKEHHATLLDMNKSNLPNSWRILKEVINKKKRSTVSPKFILNNSVITDKKSVANRFNTFFTNIGPTLANKIPSTNMSATNYIRQGRLKDSIFLNPTSEEEIGNIIKLLKNGSSGWDEISAKISSKSHVVHCWNRYAIYSTYHCSLGCFLMNLNLLRLFLYIKQVMLRSSQTIGRYQYYQFSLKSLNDSCIIVY